MPSRFIHSMIEHPQLQHRQVDAPPGRQGLAQELGDRDAGDLLRVLEGQEHAGLAAHVGRPAGDVLALEQDPARRHLVGGVAEQGVGQRRLARAVGPHQGVHLAGADDQVDALEDLGAFDGHVEVLDLEQRGSSRPQLYYHYGDRGK